MTQVQPVNATTSTVVGAIEPCLRVRHFGYAIVLVFGHDDAPWEMTIPDCAATLDYVRISIREFGAAGGAEASTPMAWADYAEACEWLRCLSEGRHSQADLDPALRLLRDAFGPLTKAIGL